MNEGQIHRSDRLFDCIGLIDDRFIAEANTSYAPMRRKVLLKRAVIIGVAAILSLSIVLGTLAAGSVAILISGLIIGGANKDSHSAEELFPGINDMVGDYDNIESDGEKAEDIYYSSTSSALVSLRDKTEHLKAEGVDLSDGTKKIIWKYSDESSYRVKDLTAVEYEKLMDLIISNEGTDVTASDDEIDGIWISLGDGRVISPELKDAETKQGYGELFSYTAEYKPSVQFNEYLYSVISK